MTTRRENIFKCDAPQAGPKSSNEYDAQLLGPGPAENFSEELCPKRLEVDRPQAHVAE